jgi:hypothetical protein
MFNLSGCGMLSIFSSEDEVNTLNLAKSLLKEQVDEHGEPREVKMPVRVHYTTTRKPMIDHEMLIEFEFITEEALPVLRFAVTTSDGLELVDNDIDPLYSKLSARQVIKSEIEVKPTSENKFYVNLFIVTEIGEDKRARHMKIPIAIGDYSLSDNPTPRQ